MQPLDSQGNCSIQSVHDSYHGVIISLKRKCTRTNTPTRAHKNAHTHAYNTQKERKREEEQDGKTPRVLLYSQKLIKPQHFK